MQEGHNHVRSRRYRLQLALDPPQQVQNGPEHRNAANALFNDSLSHAQLPIGSTSAPLSSALELSIRS